MKIADYKEYFEATAKSNIMIGHNPPAKIAFASIDIEEVIVGLRNDYENRMLFLEAPEIKPKDALSDNPRKLFTGGLLIVRPTEKGNTEDIMLALDEANTVCEQILAKILNDTKKHKINAAHIFKIKGFDVNSVRMQKVGPLWGSWYGFRMTFELDQTFPNKLILSQADWNSDTPFSI